jgi:hypothetical protein
MLYTSPWSRFELTTSVVLGTDVIIVEQIMTINTSHTTRLFLILFRMISINKWLIFFVIVSNISSHFICFYTF